jgi:alkanesulfonate monooxygenase SsuD/methylene tetrahydromethanopterin reductase-like flavin-dependent oxidoreductase (luciferase family)
LRLHKRIDFAAEIRQALKETDAKAREAYKRQAAEYLEKARHLEAMEDALYEHFCTGVIDKGQYKRNVAKIRADRERYFSLHHQTELAIHESYTEVADRLLELAINAESKYKAMSPVEKRDFIKTVCSNHLLDGQTVHYSLKNSFRLLVAMRGNEGWLTLLGEFRTSLQEFGSVANA